MHKEGVGVVLITTLKFIMNLFDETRLIMKKYNISANKKLGQNFLIDESVVDGIVENSNIGENDLVIEIGPGLGTLTSKLAEKAKKVICIELDSKMVNLLKDRFIAYKNIEIINDDCLKVDINSLILKGKEEGCKSAKVVANLPYYITTPIIMKLLEERLNIESITVMIQKEVAHRLADVPGGKESGSITYTIWYYSEPEILFDVPNSSFIPEPEVTSTVIKFNILEKPRIEVNDEEKFFKVIKASFMQKRKTLVNSLVNGGVISSKEEAEKILTSIGLDTKIRGEKLSLEDFKNLSEKI